MRIQHAAKVTDEVVQAILEKKPNLEAATKKLMNTNANGGVDNVTGILAQYQPQ